MIFGREPALWLAALQAILAVGVGFGLNLSPEQFGLLMAAAAALAGLAVRAVVTPVAAPKLPAGTVVEVETAGDAPNERTTV